MSRFKIPAEWRPAEFPSKQAMVNLCRMQISKGHLETCFAVSYMVAETWQGLSPLECDYIAAQAMTKNPMKAGGLLLQL